MISRTVDIDEVIAEIDRQVLIDIAAALKIPEENHDKAVIMLQQAIRSCLQLDQRIKDFPNLDKKDREALKQIATSAQDLSIKLNRSSEAVLRFLDVQWAIMEDRSPGEIADATAFLNALDVIQVADTEIKPGKDGPKPKNPVLRQLVGWLEGVTAELDGAASIKGRGRSGEQPGRLIASLNLLRPIFPHGAIPEKLPLGTLRKWKEEHSRIRRELKSRK